MNVTAPPIDQHAPMDCGNSFEESHHPKSEFDMDKAKDIVMETMKEQTKNTVAVPGCAEKPISDGQSNANKNVEVNEATRKSSVTGPDASKPLRKKAKLMRMERKAQKLTLANKVADDIPKKEPKNIQKSLDTLLNEVQGDSRHKLEVSCILRLKLKKKN